jgi:hypothetical protein
MSFPIHDQPLKSDRDKKWRPAMNREWQKDMQIRSLTAAASLPPAMVEETGWDILLALHSDRRGELGLDKLGSMISVPAKAIRRWLADLEDRELLVARQIITGELRAVLTNGARQMLDDYLSASSGLRFGTRH